MSGFDFMWSYKFIIHLAPRALQCSFVDQQAAVHYHFPLAVVGIFVLSTILETGCEAILWLVGIGQCSLQEQLLQASTFLALCNAKTFSVHCPRNLSKMTKELGT